MLPRNNKLILKLRCNNLLENVVLILIIMQMFIDLYINIDSDHFWNLTSISLRIFSYF